MLPDFIKGRTFAITGGCGLIGSHVAEHLLDAGAAKVVLFDRAEPPEAQIGDRLASDARVTVKVGDVLHPGEVVEAFSGVAGVFHTAACYHHHLVRNLPASVEVNIQGTMNVLEACRLVGVRRIVLSSSISAFGNTAEASVEEDAPYVRAGVDPVAAIYGVGKVLAEHLCALYAKGHGLEWTSLRLSSVYGARQHGRGLNVAAILSVLDQLDAGGAPVLEVDPDELRDFIHVDDVARAQVQAMAAATQNEVFTIAGGQPISFRRVIEAAIQAYGSDATVTYRDDKSRVRAAGVTHYSIAKAKRMLGWEPQIGLPAGMADLLSWRAGDRAPRV